MKRVLEPELMDEEQQAITYAQENFSESNQLFVDRLMLNFPGRLRRVLDIGCGPADVLIRLAGVSPDIRITAIDGSGPMIRIARQAVREHGLLEQITLVQGYVPGIPMEDHSFDAILSKDVLHHLPDPSGFWSEIKQLGKPGAAVFIMDLYRPETPEKARKIVEGVNPDETPILKLDFYNSLCAAFTVNEIEEQIRRAHLNLLAARVSERHMLIKGFLPV
jgi:ubiquinone/menaquinone biosynthesis C-methylase UbiE